MTGARFLGGWFFSAVCLFLAIGVTFTPPRLTKFCHVHGIVLIAQWEKRSIEKLAFLCMKVGTWVMILARNSKNCSFSSRKRWKNSTFSVPSYRMTIHTFESAKKWSECGIFQELQLIFWGNPVLQWCRVFYLALCLIAIEVWISRMLILAQIAANKPQNPVNSTKYNSQFTRIIFYCKLSGICSNSNIFFYIPYKLLYFPEIIIYAKSCGS